MFTAALVVFAVAALGGATIAYLRVSNKNIPLPLALVHGILAATGLVLLIIGLTEGGSSGIKTALVVFLIAALGGFTLFSYQLRSRPLPVPLVFIHGGVAVVAFVILLLSVL
jgi:hypothetical protein